MKLTLATNIGRPDAKKLGLDFEKAKRGNEVNVKQDVADILLKNGWAIQTGSNATVAESAAAANAEDEEPDFKSMTVEQLRTFAKDNEIEGVTTTMNRDETVAAVRKGYKKNFNKVR